MTLPYKFKAICNHCDKHVSWEHAVVIDDPEKPWLGRYLHAVCVEEYSDVSAAKKALVEPGERQWSEVAAELDLPSENLSLQVGDQDDDAVPPMDERQSGDSQ